jgi:hypothetical protein
LRFRHAQVGFDGYTAIPGNILRAWRQNV